MKTKFYGLIYRNGHGDSNTFTSVPHYKKVTSFRELKRKLDSGYYNYLKKSKSGMRMVRVTLETLN